MKQVVIFPRGQLNDKDRKSLSRAGVCVVEADDPSKVVCALPGVPLLSGDDLLTAAVAALAGSGTDDGMRRTFVKMLGDVVKHKAGQAPQ